jgi:hypothetical protein
LREIRDLGGRLQGRARDAEAVRTAYLRTVERLAAEAQRGRHRVVVELHGGRRGTFPSGDAPTAILAALGIGGGRRGGGGGRQNAVFVPDPAFCAALGCKLVYPKGGQICVVIGCNIGVGTLTCVALCFSMNGSGPVVMQPMDPSGNVSNAAIASVGGRGPRYQPEDRGSFDKRDQVFRRCLMNSATPSKSKTTFLVPLSRQRGT